MEATSPENEESNEKSMPEIAEAADTAGVEPQHADKADDESALQHHIRTKGGGYYYAHKKKDEWDDSMAWDGKEQPRLLAKQSVIATPPTKPNKSITSYGFEDLDSKVKVYVSFPGVGELPDEDIKFIWDEDSFELRVNAADNQTHVLKVNTYEPISGAKHKKKANKILLILTKENAYTWTNLKKGD